MYLILGFTNRTSYLLACYLLQNKKEKLVIVDQQNTINQQDMLLELSKLGTVYNELGSQEVTLLDKYPIQKIFISPGVPRSISLIQKALSLGIEILNDIEYFYREFPDRTYIAVTGTDGKTTVTTWLGDTIATEKPVVLVGNIGIPIFEYADLYYQDHIFVVELSSFQLESIQQFHPHIAVITNIHADHLDRYDDINHYASIKKNIFTNQNATDLALINKDNNYTHSFAIDINADIKYFSLIKETNWYYKDKKIYTDNKVFINTKDLKVVGIHNFQNAIIVSIIASALGISQNNIYKALTEFQGVAHRLEFVDNKNGVLFYNDSKSTTVQSLKLAIQSFNRPILLLAGGRSKGMDFSEIRDIIKQSTKKIFVFGELAEELSRVWYDSESYVCKTLEEAFDMALLYAEEQDIVLLSPGGTSFDEFTSYIERGNFFINLVKNK
ncbi:MAG: UDP-N-acetylmuramoyl-L-alanine--D-glutamate ligase [Spirochaetota bacterium]|nr:UDP-N-acetylmuramoyl-L-alanine--D-glutamate ligase [Spirochaetota bacterium]